MHLDDRDNPLLNPNDKTEYKDNDRNNFDYSSIEKNLKTAAALYQKEYYPDFNDKDPMYVTAKKLIQEYQDFDSIILAAKEGKIKGKMAQKIIDGEAMGRECLKLATIKLDVDLPFELDSLLYKGYEYSKAKAFTSKYELKQLEAKLSSSDLEKEEKKSKKRKLSAK